MMAKNPFSFYDFLGYLFPGLTTLMLTAFVVYLYNTNGLHVPIDNYIQIKEFADALEREFGLNWLESTVLVVVFSYIMGHIVAYLSSVTIEYFANSTMGYPSYYLLHKGKTCNIFKVFFQGNKGWTAWKMVYRMLLFIALLPIIIFTIPKTLRRFISRPLDEYVINSIQAKLMDLSKTLNLNIPDVNSKADYHRIVMHYVYLNIPQSQRKADNYVAIYGFLRAMALIACLFFNFLFVTQLLTINLLMPVNWDAVIILLVAFVLTNILFMGFVKFYRRFTLENYMALLTEKK